MFQISKQWPTSAAKAALAHPPAVPVQAVWAVIPRLALLVLPLGQLRRTDMPILLPETPTPSLAGQALRAGPPPEKSQINLLRRITSSNFSLPRTSPPGTGQYITAATLRAAETRLLPIPPNPIMRCLASSPPHWAPARRWAATEPTAPLTAPSQPAVGLPSQQRTDWLEPMHLRLLKRTLLWAVTAATAEEAEARQDCAGLAMSPTAGSLRLLSLVHRDQEARAAREDREATGSSFYILMFQL